MHPSGPPDPGHQAHTRVFAVIPARYASTRFPGKALAELAGKPLIEHVYRRAAACRALHDVIVATDDARIVRAVRAFGGHVQMTSALHHSGTDRVAEVARTLECDLIVNVQGDEPLVEPATIEQSLDSLLTDPSLVMSTVYHRFADPAEAADPHAVKIVVSLDGFALYFSRAPIPFVRAQPESRTPNPESQIPIYKHIGLFAYRRDFLLTLASLTPTPLERAEALEQLRALEHGYRIKAVETAYDSIGVDTPEDLERVRHLMTAAART